MKRMEYKFMVRIKYLKSKGNIRTPTSNYSAISLNKKKSMDVKEWKIINVKFN